MKWFYIVFAGVVIFDGAILPSFGTPGWFPSLTLAALPFLFLFSSGGILWVLAALTVLFLWATSTLNLGVLTLSLGIMIFFLRWFLVRIFQRDSWQMILASTTSVLVFAFVVAGLHELLMPGKSPLSTSFVLSGVLSAALAAGVTFSLFKVLQKQT